MLPTVYLLVLTCAVAGITSCDLFEPRTPEEPTAARGTFVPPTTADIVIENFVNAINERNTQHYVQCFVGPDFPDATYQFIPTERAQRQFGNIFDQWGVQDERMYFENLLSSVPLNRQLSMTLQNERFETQTANHAIFRATYRLVAAHTHDGYPHYEFIGTLRFEMITDQANNWWIHRWADFADEETPSWSELKGTFKL